MTDKQIIIDGVDVSECEFFAQEDDYCSYSGVTYAYKGQCMCSDEEMCKEHPNCFYKKVIKQLKAKEQECKELKEYLNQIRDEELSHLDIEWDEYETSARQEDYSNIITLVERALGEIDD